MKPMSLHEDMSLMDSPETENMPTRESSNNDSIIIEHEIADAMTDCMTLNTEDVATGNGDAKSDIETEETIQCTSTPISEKNTVAKSETSNMEEGLDLNTTENMLRLDSSGRTARQKVKRFVEQMTGERSTDDDDELPDMTQVSLVFDSIIQLRFVWISLPLWRCLICNLCDSQT